MKRKVSSFSRISGITVGVMLVITVGIFAVISVITNEDFWLKQNDRYNHQETLSLVSSDDYSILYHSYISMLQGKPSDFTVTLKGNPDDFTDTFKKLGSLHPSVAKMHFKKNILLEEKFLETIEKIEKVKYSKVDLNNKIYIEFSCPLANTEFSGVNIENLKIKDSKGKEFEVLLKSVSVLKDGSIKYEEVEKTETLLFKPQSKSTSLRAYISGVDIESINLSFDACALDGSIGINVKLSYEDELTNIGVASIIGPEKDIITEDEKNQLISAGETNNILKIVAVTAFVLAVITVIYTVKKQGRESLYGVGVYTVTVSVITLVIINLLVYLVPASWGFEQVFSFSENSVSSVVMGQGFMNDFALGSARFFDFLMLMPLFIGYVFIKISTKKHYDPNEDYLYQ